MRQCQEAVIVVAVASGACNITARLAQSVERKALNLVVVGSSPTVGALPILGKYLPA